MTDTSEDDTGARLQRKVLITEPGIYDGITAREYFAEPCPDAAITNSGLKTLLKKTAADFAYEHPVLSPDGADAASTAAKRLGDIVHQLTLGKGRGYAIGAFKAWNSNDAKAFRDKAINEGLTPIKTAEYEKAKTMAGVQKMLIARQLSEIGAEMGIVEPDDGFAYETEIVCAWREETPHGTVWARAMADVWCEELWTILDPKNTDMLYKEDLSRQAHNMGWAMQSAWYRRGFEKIIPEAAGRIRFVNLLVAPSQPHVSRAIEIEEAWRYRCQMEIEAGVDYFAKCLAEKNWPGFPAGVETLHAPPWLLAQDPTDLHAINAPSPAGKLAWEAEEEDETANA